MSMAWRAILAAGLLMMTSYAQAEDGQLNAYLETVRAKYMLPALAAAVVMDGEVVASGAVGVRALGRDVPVTINDRFHLGSDTKAMTATLAGMMVDEGKLRWDSTIGEVLGGKVTGMNPALAAVTLEQLLSHTSGIPPETDEVWNIYFNTNAFQANLDQLRIQALDTWKANKPEVPEGAPFQYSNLGYLIAGAMIETAAGEPWEQLIHERLFEPLGLSTAGLGAQATFGLLDAPVGHRTNDDSLTPSTPLGDQSSATPMFWGAGADAPPMVGPAGLAHMSILDFAKWAGWNAGKGKRGPALVTPETLGRIHNPHVTVQIENPSPGLPKSAEYGLGWVIVKMDWSDAPVLTHDGTNLMNLARITIDTEADFGIVVTSNIFNERARSAATEITEHLYLDYKKGNSEAQ